MVRWNRQNRQQTTESEGRAAASGESRGRWHNTKPDSVKDKEDKAYDKFADMLIKKLEGFDGNWEKPWFDVGLQWPKSIYGKPYNGMNALNLTLLCEFEGYKIPVFATHDRIFALNFEKDENGNRIPAVDKENGEKLPFVHVEKGQSAFPVFLSQTNIVHKDTKEKISYADYVKLTSEEQENYNIYHNLKVFPVFNIDQTNLKEARPELYDKLLQENGPKEIPEIKEGEDYTFAPVDKMIADNSWICPIHIQGNRAFFRPSTPEICVPEKAQFPHRDQFYSTLFHEMTHSTGDDKHLKRLNPEDSFGSPGYAREELVAEVGKALTCQRYGIPCHMKDDTLPYLKSWLSSLHEDPKFIKTVLNDVKLATGMIASHIDDVAIKIKESSKLDLRDDEDDDLQYDEDGNVINIEGGHYSPDKKQGEEESKGERESEKHQEQRSHCR